MLCCHPDKWQCVKFLAIVAKHVRFWGRRPCKQLNFYVNYNQEMKIVLFIGSKWFAATDEGLYSVQPRPVDDVSCSMLVYAEQSGEMSKSLFISPFWHILSEARWFKCVVHPCVGVFMSLSLQKYVRYVSLLSCLLNLKSCPTPLRYMLSSSKNLNCQTQRYFPWSLEELLRGRFLIQ